MPPQTSPDLGLFIVVSGGGWVQVGDERSTINHGEAVEWPPGVVHAAWTDGSPMRAILVEVPDEAIAMRPRPGTAAGAAHRPDAASCRSGGAGPAGRPGAPPRGPRPFRR